MSSNAKEKFVGQIERFAIDWREHLSNANDGSSDTIATATWTIGGDDSTLIQDSSSFSGDVTIIQVSAGTAKEEYTLQCKLTLSSSAITPIGFLTVDVKADPVP